MYFLSVYAHIVSTDETESIRTPTHYIVVHLKDPHLLESNHLQTLPRSHSVWTEEFCPKSGAYLLMQDNFIPFYLTKNPFYIPANDMNVSHVSTVGLPVTTVTPEGVISVAQWVLLILICYGVIALAYLLVTFFLRCLWWLLKVVVALACFGLILNDHSVGTETKAVRLLCLGSVCILLSIRPWRNRTMAARIVYLEKQVKILENRLREMARWKRRYAILSCFLAGLLFFVFFIVFRVYYVISNSKTL